MLDATKFLTGTGTNEPTGILNIGGTNGLTTTQRAQTAGVAAYAVGDPWLLKAAIPARFINSTTFAAAPATFDTTYRFVGGNSTEPLQFGNGDRGGYFLGRPKVEWSTMATGATTDTKLIIGGDFRTGYKIVDRIGMAAELIPQMFGATQPIPARRPWPIHVLADRRWSRRRQRVPVPRSEMILSADPTPRTVSCPFPFGVGRNSSPARGCLAGPLNRSAGGRCAHITLLKTG